MPETYCCEAETILETQELEVRGRRNRRGVWLLRWDEERRHGRCPYMHPRSTSSNPQLASSAIYHGGLPSQFPHRSHLTPRPRAHGGTEGTVLVHARMDKQTSGISVGRLGDWRS